MDNQKRNRRPHHKSSYSSNDNHPIRRDSRERLIRFIKEMEGEELVALFDIGTKAARIIVAPKKVPSKNGWNRSFFFNDGNLFNLGKDLIFNRTLDIENSNALSRINMFIGGYVKILTSNGVKLENIDAIGTAVFRWMINQEEVVLHIKEKTEVDLFVLNEKAESLLSLYSIKQTYNISNQNSPPKETFDDEDVIVLVDQGGGSTEISYLFPTVEDKIKVDSIDSLGTIALSNYFFTLDQDGKSIDPKQNTNRINTQHDRVIELINQRISNWEQYPELEGKNIIMYAMGSAFSSCLPKGNNFRNHNTKMPIKNAWDIIRKLEERYEQEDKEIRELYQETQSPSKGSRSNDRLSIFYGLPVYLEMMSVFNCREIYFAGFGLRYGAYIYKYSMHKSFEDISISIFTDEKEDELWEQTIVLNTIEGYTTYLEEYPNGNYTKVAQRKIEKLGKDQKKLKVFISYSHEDKKEMKRLDQHLESLKTSNLIDTWYDEEIIGGEKWDDSIKSKLENADIILFLVSVDLITSSYVKEVELPKALERMESGNVKVVPIILDHVDIKDMEFDKIQAIPRGKKPIKKYDSLDEGMKEVVLELRKIVENMTQ